MHEDTPPVLNTDLLLSSRLTEELQNLVARHHAEFGGYPVMASLCVIRPDGGGAVKFQPEGYLSDFSLLDVLTLLRTEIEEEPILAAHTLLVKALKLVEKAHHIRNSSPSGPFIKH